MNMTRKLLFVCLMTLYLTGLNAQVQPTWESIEKRGYPQWFSDAKLGIFIHWGVYSVSSYASAEPGHLLFRQMADFHEQLIVEGVEAVELAPQVH